MSTIVEFTVAGLPGTKGSAQAHAHHNPVTGKTKAWTSNDAGPRAKSWASVVGDAAREAMAGIDPFRGPVTLHVTFRLPRPRAHYLPVNRKRPMPVLRDDAPSYVVSKPDGDKLERCAWDALTGIVFADDAQIVEWSGSKRYHAQSGAVFTIREVTHGT